MILQQPELLRTSNGSMENSQRSGNVLNAVLWDPRTPDTTQDTRVLNRIITLKEDGIWWEQDARHAELVISLLGDGPGGAKRHLH